MDVAAVGTPFFDEILLIDKLPETDQHPKVLDTSWQYGGKVATALVALGRLGHSAAIHGLVGGAFGRCIRTDFERHGVDCSRLIDVPGTQSGVCLCLAEKSTGGRSFMGFKHPHNTPAIGPDQLDKNALMRADWLLISDLDEAAALAASWFQSAGKPVVMDADSMDELWLDKLHLVDHLIPSEYVFKQLYGGASYGRALRHLRALQHNESAVTIFTLGAEGLVGINEHGEFFRLPAYKVPVVDTTGAGDVFHGAYIAGKLRNLSTEEACRFASAVSAVKCTRIGGRAGIPNELQTKEFMEVGKLDFAELDEREQYYRKPPFDE